MPIFRVSHCGTDLQPDLTQPLWSPARSPVALQYPRAQPACRNRAPGAAFPFSQSAVCSVLPKEKQRNQITAKTPSPGSSAGHRSRAWLSLVWAGVWVGVAAPTAPGGCGNMHCAKGHLVLAQQTGVSSGYLLRLVGFPQHFLVINNLLLVLTHQH